MVLGELYRPSGLAHETASQVLEAYDVLACNVATGCLNQCKYCYGPIFAHKKDWANVRFPKKSPVKLIELQVNKGLELRPTFLSFMTDPLTRDNEAETVDLVKYLIGEGVRVAVLSKCGVIDIPGVRNGATIVSVDPGFEELYEPGAPAADDRIKALKHMHAGGEYTWVSMEPYPVSALWKQNIRYVLDRINFVDFIIFGKWNYESKAAGISAKIEYQRAVTDFIDYCQSHGIRYHIKSDTRKFIGNIDTKQQRLGDEQ